MVKQVSMPLHGQSMGKTFSKDFRITIIPKKKIQNGDVVVFLNDKDKFIAHRAIFWQGKLKTKGDANKHFDSFSIKKIIGIAKIDETWLLKKTKVIQMKAKLFILMITNKN